MLGFCTFGGVRVGLPESSVDCLPQVFFGLKYSPLNLIEQPLGLFLYPVIDEGSLDIREECHGLSVWVGHNICVGVHSSIDLECQHKSLALFSISFEFEGRVSF